MARDTSTETLREAAQALRDWLARLDRERVGQLAACYIDHATHLLDDEAMTLITGKPGKFSGLCDRTTFGGDDTNLQ